MYGINRSPHNTPLLPTLLTVEINTGSHRTFPSYLPPSFLSYLPSSYTPTNRLRQGALPSGIAPGLSKDFNFFLAHYQYYISFTGAAVRLVPGKKIKNAILYPDIEATIRFNFAWVHRYAPVIGRILLIAWVRGNFFA